MVFKGEIFIFFELHIGDTIAAGFDMGTEDTFMEAITVLNEKRVANFAGTNDIVGISAICRVIDAEAKLGIAGALASNTII